MLEITLPNGATIAATGADVAAALAIVTAPTVLPVPTVPTPEPVQVAPQAATEAASEPAAPKSESKSARKAANQAAQTDIARLRKAGDHDAADAIARERGWSVPARASVPVPVSVPVPEPVPEPAVAAAPTAPTESSAPASEPVKAKRDRSQGGTRRANGHKLDCACAMCVKTMGAKPVPTVSTHERAMMPASDAKARQVKQADKSSAVSTKRGPIPTHSETPVADVLRQSERDEKRDALRRHQVLDACSEVRDDVRERVTAAVRAGDLDGLDALVIDLDAQITDQSQTLARCEGTGDGLGAWEAHELGKALGKALAYASTSLDEMLED